MSGKEQELIKEKNQLIQEAREKNERIIKINEELIEIYSKRLVPLSDSSLDFLGKHTITYNMGYGTTEIKSASCNMLAGNTIRK